jgi:alkylation response protein AidB-like acyl-CoA dehydrogenase
MRKATAKMMEDNYHKFDKHTDEASFPEWMVDHFRQLKINGLQIKGYGSAGLTTVEAGALCYELAKRDGSLATFFLVHNAIGMAVINALGDEEQKQRLLTPGMNFDKIFCFGLTEPENGSDASGLRTTATKVEGGYLLNGRKRWIGNGTFGDVIVWARNPADGNRV